jgi:AraC-like DNA-binding protein
LAESFETRFPVEIFTSKGKNRRESQEKGVAAKYNHLLEGDEMEQWEQINAVQKMQDYIDQHLYEPITLSDLSRNTGYSPFHCAKLFKEHTGKPPFEYIRTLRLSRAALKLRDEKVKVLDVAMDFVFDSHEGFTRAFSKNSVLRRINTAKIRLPSSCSCPARSGMSIYSIREVEPL